MAILDAAALYHDLGYLRTQNGVDPGPLPEDVMLRILRPLLAANGYKLDAPTDTSHDALLATAKADGPAGPFVLGVHYRHYSHGKILGSGAVQQTLEAALKHDIHRLLLIVRRGFSSDAEEFANRRRPHVLTLLTLDSLGDWIDRTTITQPQPLEALQIFVRALSHELAVLVARDPAILNALEWRDLERMMARIFAGLGFAVILTPPSKDGGKDLLLSLSATKDDTTYAVELKHWIAGGKVGRTTVSSFVEVVANERRQGGLLLSTSGFTATAFATLTAIVRQRIRFGGRQKIIALANTYERASQGLWSPPAHLPDVLFEATE